MAVSPAANLERPALQRLLADVDAGLVDTIVVYKIDRLTRSLADFARIVERLEAKGASFVAVTQAFNTTTSMGRLTLNVLLSFAQFEREVTAERIRDKIKASKQKGMWMGGTLPLGYEAPTDLSTRALVINPGRGEDGRRHLRSLSAARIRGGAGGASGGERRSLKSCRSRRRASPAAEAASAAAPSTICSRTAPTLAKSPTGPMPTPERTWRSSLLNSSRRSRTTSPASVAEPAAAQIRTGLRSPASCSTPMASR